MIKKDTPIIICCRAIVIWGAVLTIGTILGMGISKAQQNHKAAIEARRHERIANGEEYQLPPYADPEPAPTKPYPEYTYNPGGEYSPHQTCVPIPTPGTPKLMKCTNTYSHQERLEQICVPRPIKCTKIKFGS